MTIELDLESAIVLALEVANIRLTDTGKNYYDNDLLLLEKSNNSLTVHTASLLVWLQRKQKENNLDYLSINYVK